MHKIAGQSNFPSPFGRRVWWCRFGCASPPRPDPGGAVGHPAPRPGAGGHENAGRECCRNLPNAVPRLSRVQKVFQLKCPKPETNAHPYRKNTTKYLTLQVIVIIYYCICIYCTCNVCVYNYCKNIIKRFPL